MTGPAESQFRNDPRARAAPPPRHDSPEQDQSLAPLLRDAALGDEAAWRSLVQRYAHRVYALARSRRLGEEAAEEITQSVFATLAERLRAGEYAEQGRFESWLFRITVNRVRDEARRARRHAEPTDPSALSDVAPAAPSQRPTGAGGGAAAELDALRDALSRLSDPDREIIELRHHASLSFRQISDLLNEPLGTVLARHHRALRKLKEILGPDPRCSFGDQA